MTLYHAQQYRDIYVLSSAVTTSSLLPTCSKHLYFRLSRGTLSDIVASDPAAAALAEDIHRHSKQRAGDGDAADGEKAVAHALDGDPVAGLAVSITCQVLRTEGELT
jgi:hypothetical protein